MLLGALLASAGAAVAVVPEVGVEYAAGTRIEAPEYGAALTIPEGWLGTLPPGSEAFVLGSGTGGARIVVLAEETTVEEALETMRQPIPLGGGLVLTPVEEPEVEGSSVSGSYSVRGTPQLATGLVRTTVGPRGVGVALIGFAPASERADLSAALERVAASLDLAPASAPAPPRPGPGSESNPWHRGLAGQKLQRFHSGSSYTESSSLALCANGRFYRDLQAGGHGPGASGAYQGTSTGRWSAEGGDEEGTLLLEFDDGRGASYRLTATENSDGSWRLFLDGERWFREPVRCE